MAQAFSVRLVMSTNVFQAKVSLPLMTDRCLPSGNGPLNCAIARTSFDVFSNGLSVIRLRSVIIHKLP